MQLTNIALQSALDPHGWHDQQYCNYEISDMSYKLHMVRSPSWSSKHGRHRKGRPLAQNCWGARDLPTTQYGWFRMPTSMYSCTKPINVTPILNCIGVLQEEISWLTHGEKQLLIEVNQLKDEREMASIKIAWLRGVREIFLIRQIALMQLLWSNKYRSNPLPVYGIPRDVRDFGRTVQLLEQRAVQARASSCIFLWSRVDVWQLSRGWQAATAV